MTKSDSPAPNSTATTGTREGMPAAFRLSRMAEALLRSQDEAAKALLASQSTVAELLRAHNFEGASVLQVAQDEAARTLLVSQSALAELLSSHNLADASTLLAAQEDAARALLVSQSAVAESLHPRNVEVAADLPETEDQTKDTLLASQSSVAELLHSFNLQGAADLLETQEEAARKLLSSQAALAQLLSSHNVHGAAVLLAAQEEEASRLLASQGALAEFLGLHNIELATITAVNAELEHCVAERTQELTHANANLEAVSVAKSRFLASMSHELRTPLNTIIGFSGLLMAGTTGKLQPEQKRQVEMINSAGNHLLQLVNEVLDLSAIEAGRINVVLEEVDIRLTVREVVESLVPLAEAAGLDLSFEIAPDATTMKTDRLRLEQVLINLLGNAIKFTDSGSVRLDARVDGGEIVLTVTDTGRGIPEEDLALVFDEFHQVQHSNRGKCEGTGIGLSVSKRLVELLGGTLSAQSVSGEGATFTVRLPLEDVPVD